MPASKSSAALLRSNRIALAGVILALSALSIAAVRYCLARGYTLYFGDAEAHLNIARRILDSRTPGPEQLGTVWLPLPHLAMIPFVLRDSWWRSGLGGAIPSAICFVAAGAFLFAAARRAYGSLTAALVVAAIFAINPNLLYLQATPMTETMFLAALAALLWATLWFRDSQSLWAILAAAIASNAASLTRYEGWFLIPFVALYLLAAARKKWHAVLFGALAALGPLAWLAHNQYYYSNALEFYNGPYSAMAIYHRQLAAGLQPYPGDHDWRTAIRYYFGAARLVAGTGVLLLGAAGAVVCIMRRTFWPIALLALAPAFYVWSMHSSGTPIYIPTLWPFSWYNTRYAVAMVPLAAFAAGGLIAVIPANASGILKGILAAAIIAVAAGIALHQPVCWKESEVNSRVRRNWTSQAAEFLAAHYDRGAGILYSFGDLTAVLRQAGIPLREGLHQGNHPAWDAAVARPDLALHEGWALAVSGDEVSTLMMKAQQDGLPYRVVKRIVTPGAPVVEIYRRQP